MTGRIPGFFDIDERLRELSARRGMTGETISVTPALLWRLRIARLTWQVSTAVMEAFQVRAHRLVASPSFGRRRRISAPIKAWICSLKNILVADSVRLSYTRLFAEIEIAISKEEATRAAGTDEIMAQSRPPLPNFRQEAFAQRMAAGLSATAAYASAYGQPRDVSSRVNGRRLLTKAYIRERIAKIESDAALSALPTIRRVLDEAGSTTVDRIRNGSFKQACKAVDCFADTVLKLSRALSQQSGSDERGKPVAHRMARQKATHSEAKDHPPGTFWRLALAADTTQFIAATAGLATRANEAPMLQQEEQSPMIKKFTVAGALLAAAGPLLGCAHVRQEDLAE
jgi:hypothetical protein